MSDYGVGLFKQSIKTENGSEIQFNKGHFCLDTNERLKNFSEKLAAGWEDEYYEYRRKWTEYPAKKIIGEYPLLVDLELASVCNLKCPMCYTITDEFKQKVTKGFMDFDLYKRIIDEIANKVYAIRISFRGEATMHANFVECIEYAKKSGIKEISTLTNGATLNGTNLERIIKAGIDWITISIDGTGSTYEKIRKPISFQKIVNNVKEIHQYKIQNNLIKPVIKIQGIWPAIREDPDLYYKTFSPISDLVAFNPLIDFVSRDDESQIVYEDNFSCPQFYQRLVIGSDGRCLLCTNDESGKKIVGDVNYQTVHEIWHGEILQEVRSKHNKKNGFKCLNVCKECYYPRKAKVDETANVDGRTIYIENYINRAQEVGK